MQQEKSSYLRRWGRSWANANREPSSLASMRSTGSHAIYPSPSTLNSSRESVGDSCNPHALSSVFLYFLFLLVLFLWPLTKRKREKFPRCSFPKKRGREKNFFFPLLLREDFLTDAETMRLEHDSASIREPEWRNFGGFGRQVAPTGRHFYSLQWLRGGSVRGEGSGWVQCSGGEIIFKIIKRVDKKDMEGIA